ncbi:MAG: ParB/RepB/Spo0J family partition protein [Synergistales bacterium]|nr:ParB/RepB/Spo0J family partition protein [Synergistales bacterium]
MAKALGRGLGALLPGASPRPAAPSPVVELPLSSLRPNPRQPRREISREGLASLALSLGSHGVIEPIIVRPTADGHEIVAGERRWQAAKLAGLESVPVRVLDLDDAQILEVALVENLQREDLSPLEIAGALQSLLETTGITQDEAAGRLGWSRTTVTNKLRLLQLPSEIQGLLAGGELTEGHCRALLGLDDERARILMAERCRDEGWSVRELERAVQGAGRRRLRREKDPLQEVHPEAARLRERYGIAVSLSRRGEKRSIRISGLAEEELQAILDLLDSQGERLFPGKYKLLKK